jgi:hypothetical protein
VTTDEARRASEIIAVAGAPEVEALPLHKRRLLLGWVETSGLHMTIARMKTSRDRDHPILLVLESIGAVLDDGGAGPADPDWEAIVNAFDEWHARPGNFGERMPKEELMAEANVPRDRLDRALRRHGVTDSRHLAAYLKGTRRTP